MTFPAQVLDLRAFKLTLPIGDPGKPKEIKQPELARFSDPNWFYVDATGGVRFRAPVNGVTTSGSGYPRSELREMTTSGKNASWAGKTGWHVLTVVEAFTRLPNDKPHLVGAQIHDAKKDWCVFRLEGTKLYVTKFDDPHFALADANYVLGTPFTARFVVYNGLIMAFYNGRLVATLDAKKLKGGYFKAGAYVQANCTNSGPCSNANYGETVVYWTSVIHADKPGLLPVPPVPVPTPVPVPDPTPVPVPTGQTRGVGGIAAPAGATLATADSTAAHTFTAPGVYDGQGHTIGRPTLKGKGITVQNYKIIAGGQYGAVLDGGNTPEDLSGKSDLTLRNCDISGIKPSGDGDLNVFSAFGNNITIRDNTIPVGFIDGDPGGSHTDFIQTWVSSSHPVAGCNWKILNNKAVGPANPSRDNSVPSIHQFVMAEGAGRGGNSGGSGKPSRWLIADNEIGDSWGQAIKLDGVTDVVITRNKFVGSSDHVIEVTDASSNVKFYADNEVGVGYGDIGVTVTPGAGPGSSVPTPVPVPVPTPVPAPADVVYVIRHGEKPDDPNSHVLSPQGQKRALALAELFTAVPIRQGLAVPDRIVVSEGGTASRRPAQTGQPLADRLHEVEMTQWAAADYQAAGEAIAAMHGTTLCIWAHTELPELCKAFGVKVPSSWPDNRYDVIWIFRRTATGWAFSQMPEMALPGDLSKGI